MGSRKDLQAKIRTRVARTRVAAGITQEKLAEVTGIPLATYRRLERGQLDNPPIRYLSNIALVLNVDLDEICEDDWLWWTVFRDGQPGEPPHPAPLLYPERWEDELREQEKQGKLKKGRRGHKPAWRPPNNR
jgi:transcriptional regulator with XRE-family HTH domain